MGLHNIDDLYELSKQLVSRFNKYPKCHIYIVRLFDFSDSSLAEATVEQKHRLIKATMEWQAFVDKNMPKPIIDTLPKAFEIPNTCMANNDASVMIVPDGHLGKCEHFVDSDFFGSIYSDEIDVQKISSYKEHVVVSPNCITCELRSTCLPLKCCTAIPKHCDELEQQEMKNRLHTKMNNVYNKFLELEKENSWEVKYAYC